MAKQRTSHGTLAGPRRKAPRRPAAAPFIGSVDFATSHRARRNPRQLSLDLFGAPPRRGRSSATLAQRKRRMKQGERDGLAGRPRAARDYYYGEGYDKGHYARLDRESAATLAAMRRSEQKERDQRERALALHHGPAAERRQRKRAAYLSRSGARVALKRKLRQAGKSESEIKAAVAAFERQATQRNPTNGGTNMAHCHKPNCSSRKRNPRARTFADVEKNLPLWGQKYQRLGPYMQGSEDAKFHRRARSSNRKYLQGFDDRRNKRTPYLKGIADGRAGRRPKSKGVHYMQGYETGQRQPAGERARRRKGRLRMNPVGPLKGMRNWTLGDWVALTAFASVVYTLGRWNG